MNECSTYRQAATTQTGGTSGADTQNDDAILDARRHSTYQIRDPLQMRER